MELVAGIHLVGSGRLGFELTDPWDGHAYLITSGQEALLVDTGCGRRPEAVAERIDEVLGASGALVGIALTHGHADHSGGAAALSAHYGAPVYCHAAAVAALRNADEQATGLAVARAAGVFPPDLTLTPAPAVSALPDRPISVGDLAVSAVHSPGHAADHVAYAVEVATGRVLFTGDLLFARGRVAVLGTPDTNVPDYAHSMRTVAALDPDVLLPGHGELVLANAGEHVAIAVDAFARHALPAGLLR